MYYSLLCFCFEIATFATLPALPPLFSRFALAGLHMSSVPCPDGGLLVDQGCQSAIWWIRRRRWTRAVGGNRRDPSPTCCGAFGLEWFFLLNRWIFQKKKSCNHQKMMMMMMMNFRSAQLPNHQKIYTSHKKHNTCKKCSNSSSLA